MEKFYSVSQAAEIVGMTSETLRHYDRIGLVKPGKTDKWTGYRYYTEQEIARLNTVRALRCMDLPLQEIKRVLAFEDVGQVIDFLGRAEKRANDKIAELNDVKARILRARKFYESKLSEKPHDRKTFLQQFPARTVLLSPQLHEPTVGNLWNYHRHFYAQVGEEARKDFAFEDIAGIYRAEGQANMFAVCTKYRKTDGLRVLPEGKYLCADCSAEVHDALLQELTDKVKAECGADPAFTVSIIVLSGILQWNYQIQIPYEMPGDKSAAQ